jgi:hypothetical protein
MTKPISLDAILSEFSEDDDAWVLQDEGSGQYLIIPHPKYPGRSPIHFFMSRQNAQDVLQEVLDANEALLEKEIFPVKVKLKQALRSIAAGGGPGKADGFVLHSPNEVYEFLRDQT